MKATELRLQIWRHAVVLQKPRVVELCTVPHEKCDNLSHGGGFCPRFSPSPAPVLVNVCRESRQVVYERAETEGWLFLNLNQEQPDSESKSSEKKIVFNPEIDTLYVADEKEHWIRGPEGILTQLKPWHDLIRFLASDLNRYGLQSGAMRGDIKLFHHLKAYSLVVKEFKDGDWENFKQAEKRYCGLVAGVMRVWGVWSNEKGREYPRELKLAIYRGGRLDFFVEEGPWLENKMHCWQSC